MKIVLYTSSTGFTKKYAEWIATSLKCEALPLKKAKNLASYDTVIYGGWIMGNMIMGLSKLKKLYSGDYVLFATGSSPMTPTIIETIKQENQLADVPFFYMQSGFCFEKLGFFKRTMLHLVKKSVSKKENKTEQDLFMEEALSHSFDNSDPKYIQPLVAHITGK